MRAASGLDEGLADVSTDFRSFANSGISSKICPTLRCVTPTTCATSSCVQPNRSRRMMTARCCSLRRPLMYANIDPDRLREVVSNLFENAVKYTAEGMITVGASLQDPHIIIRVSDTGMGIATEDIPHLFQKFYRTDNTKTREIGGTGLGLYISRQIVEAMGGTVWVESTVGEGSTFFIKIPRVDPSKVDSVSA